MKRKLISLLLILTLLCPVLTGFAVEERILDNADLLWNDEVADLEAKAQNLKNTYGMDVVILTVYDYEGWDIEEYADNFYDVNGFGVGEDASGVLLVIALDSREWAISTCGEAIYAITDYGIESLFEEMAWYLSDDDFYEAFDAYLAALPAYFEAYRQGKPIDGYVGGYEGPGSVEIGTKEDVVYYEETPPYWLAPLIGLAIAGIAVLIMRGSMNTKRPQHSAVSYLCDGSYDLGRVQDIYLYSQISKVRRQNQSNSGGGSSVHRSSGGRSHGGGHGRF